MTSVIYHGHTRDSGVTWLGQIPDNWGVLRVKQVFKRNNSKANNNEPVVLSLARAGVKIRDISNNEGQLAESYSNYNPVEPGDVLLNPMDLQSGANCSISKVSGVISPAYVNLRVISDYDPRFYDYYFKLQYWSRAFFAHGRGVSYDNRWTLNTETIMNYPVIVPPSTAQKKIANFLDGETAKIDNLITKQDHLLKILEEKRFATITHVVTHGLNPNVEFKETGISWLEKIPKNWELLRSSVLFTENKTANANLFSTTPLQFRFGKIIKKNVVLDDNLLDEIKRYNVVEKNDIMVNGLNLNYDFVTQRVAIVTVPGCITPAYIALRPRHMLNASYACYLLKSIDSQKILNGLGTGIRLTLNYSEFKKTSLPLPPLSEQEQIATYIDNTEAKFDTLKQKILAQIDLLKERRTSLISNAVTGKIKV